MAFFRGNRLQGKTIQIPDRFRGVVIERQVNKSVQKGSSDQEAKDTDDGSESKHERAHPTFSNGQFDEMVVWTRDGSSSDASHAHAKALGEWLQLSEQVSSIARTLNQHVNRTQIHGTRG